MATQAWCITDGAAGCISQVVGLANAMALEYSLKTVKIRNPWHYFPSGFYPLPGLALSNALTFQPQTCPRYVISSGKRSVYASRYLKSVLGKKVTTIHIQDPKISSKYFDYVIAPAHDAITGENVIKTQYTINHITDALLNNAVQSCKHDFQQYRKPLILTVLGGSNKHFAFDPASIQSMLAQIDTLTNNLQAQTMILFSRRTPAAIQALCKDYCRDKKTLLVWQDEHENPYLALLKLADKVILTCDSASMISEAITAKKQTYVYQLPLKKKHSRLQGFIDNLITHQTIGKLSVPLTDCITLDTREVTCIARRILDQEACHINT